MSDLKKYIVDSERGYHIRIMAALIVVEVIAILFFSFWPVNESTSINQKIDFSDDTIAIEDVVRTKQQNSPPPPPKPQTPIPEPTDEIIEEEPIELDDLNVSKYSDSLSVEMIGSDGDADQPVSSPQVAPQVIHIVEPTVPEAAKKVNIKAEVWVNFLVDTDGKVEEASIAEVVLYDQESGEKRTVDRINYGLTEATLTAALQWKFRPARNNGQPVKAYSRQIFTYGF
ncbi:energy transducer TonB [Fodinibius sp. SL11]|uniref:energy transducer TonB n=1 Tax=Fodinibius sp. SL11 TaxID=3425690 RepID=UPI003F88593C